ncbi:MAG: glycosyltransferase family 4 protein [Acidimicrobiales bacterium]
MRRALYICSTVPAPDGGGLAMRAGVSVEGLARHFDLTVAVVRSPSDTRDLDWVRHHAHRVVDLPLVADRQGEMSWFYSDRGRRVAGYPLPTLARIRPPSIGARIVDELGDHFDVLVVMGTYLAGAALGLLDAGVPGLLDADNDDARLCASLARLDPAYAVDVERYERFQREVFSWFEAVTFASLEDAVAPFLHLPNAVRIPPRWSVRPLGGPLELLFVGVAGYPPNDDALDRLRRGIVPGLRGLGMDVDLIHPGLEDAVVPWYERAHIAVAPLRAGGGTRIKVLEAFAHGCPVVSTRTGAAGLSVTGGLQLAITPDDDDDAAFAAEIVELAVDGERRRAMADAARTFVVSNHDHRAVGDRLSDLARELTSTR